MVNKRKPKPAENWIALHAITLQRENLFEYFSTGANDTHVRNLLSLPKRSRRPYFRIPRLMFVGVFKVPHAVRFLQKHDTLEFIASTRKRVN